jgi:hypothetical protein
MTRLASFTWAFEFGNATARRLHLGRKLLHQILKPAQFSRHCLFGVGEVGGTGLLGSELLLGCPQGRSMRVGKQGQRFIAVGLCGKLLRQVGGVRAMLIDGVLKRADTLFRGARRFFQATKLLPSSAAAHLTKYLSGA